jgi:hypothetical protein
MRSKPIKHEKHERMAMTAFIITLAVAMLALFYAYQQGRTYGQTVYGLQSYACAVYLRENPEETTCPQVTIHQEELKFYNAERRTLQTGGCWKISTMSVTKAQVMHDDEQREHLFQVCGLDEQCQCEEYFDKYQVNRPDESVTTKCIGVSDKPVFYTKRECPQIA